MQIDTMRRIDRWAGIPLCFALTWLVRLRAVFVRRDDRPSRNVLLIELSEMGSTILADPAMRKLRNRLDTELHFAIFRKNKPSLDLLKTVPEGNIFTIRDDGLGVLLLDTLRFLAWARSKQVDTVIDLELFSRFTTLLSGLSGACRRVGFHAFYNEGLYRGDLLTHKVAYNPHMHISKNFIALVNALTVDKSELPYSKTVISDEEVLLARVNVPDSDCKAMRTKVKQHCPAYDPAKHRLVLFNANGSDLMPLRRWPQDNYVQLALEILRVYPDVIILLTGAASEREGLEQIIGAVGGGRCVNMAGLTTFGELAALYEISEFMLTNDSGPGHFAAVTKLRTFVFFGPETPKLYGSLGLSIPIYANLACSPCVSAANHRKSPCDNNVCLKNISPGEVFGTLRPSLDTSRFLTGERS
jgi:ADP-heptose:LPS heptosyltransferase